MKSLLAACAALLLVSSAALAQEAGTASAPHPVEHFAKLPFLEGPELSPNGTRLAAKVAVDGVQRLVIAATDGSAKPAYVALGDNDLNWWQWVNDEWLVAGVGSAERVAGDTWYVTRTVGVRADGQKLQPIAYRDAGQDADDVIWIAEDGSPRILLSLQKSIYSNDIDFWPQVIEADVSTGKTRKVVGSRQWVMNWYVDHAGTVRMGIGMNDSTQRAMLLYRDSDEHSFHTVARANLRNDEELTYPALFLPEVGKALTFDDSEGFRSLYELDLATMTVGTKVFGVPGYDIDGLITSVGGTGLSGVRYTDDAARVHWLDPTLKQVQEDLDKAIGERRPTIVSLSRNRSKMIVAVGSPSQPPSYYFFDTAEGVMNIIASTNEALRKAKLAPVRTIRYKARDGLEIPAILTLPNGREPKALPLIVMPHGGPAVRDSEGWDWWAQFLADRGYGVVQPNYRGSTGFGREFAAKGDGEWGLKMQDDLDDAVAHLAEAGIVDRERVCVVGASYGGYAAMRAAQRDGARYRCAVSYAGVSDLSHLARVDGRSLYGKSARLYLKEKAPDFKAVSPIHFPEQFEAPVLLVHGKRDLRVPVSQSQEMAEKLRRAGKTVEYVEQPEGDHHFSREEDRLQFLKLLEAFLARHNPA